MEPSCCIAAQALAVTERRRTTRCWAPTTPTAPATRSSSPSTPPGLEGPPARAVARLLAARLRLEDMPNREVREFFAKHPNDYVPSGCAATGCASSASAPTGPSSSASPRSNRDDLEARCYRWIARLRGRRQRARRCDGDWLEPARAARRLPAPERDADRRAASSRSPTCGARARAVRARARSPPPKTTLGLLPKKEAPDERMLAEAARQPKRMLERLPTVLERRAAREVAVLAAVRYARPTLPALRRRSTARWASAPQSELRYLWGLVGYEARAITTSARSSGTRAPEPPSSRRPPSRLAGARGAARRPVAGGARIDRRHVAGKRQPSGLDLLVRSRARAQSEEPAAAQFFLRIAGQSDFYGLLANEELGTCRRCRRRRLRAERARSRGRGRRAGDARALELIRLGIRVEGVREWLFAIRSFDDQKLIAAAELARAPAPTIARSTPPTAPCACTTMRCAIRCPTTTCSASTPSRTASTKPGCSAWCGRRAASSPTRARAPAPPA